jgi:hypothetical protein
METLERVLEFVGDVFDTIEQFLLGLVAKSATWLSPMVPAIFIYSSVKVHFNFLPTGSEYLFAYVIEALGLTTIMNTMEGWQQWQRERTRASGWVLLVACVTALFYVILNILLVIVLKARPDLAAWGTGLLSTLSVVAGISTVMRVWQSQRAGQIRRERRQQEQAQQEARRQEAERQRMEFALELDLKRAEAAQRLEIERQKADIKLSNSVQRNVQKTVKKQAITPENGRTDTDEMDAMLDIYRVNPRASLRFVGNQIGRSPQTISNRLDELEATGAIHRNGNGVEVRS